MLLFIDHYDSFSHILMDYFAQLGEKVTLLKSDQLGKTINYNKFTAVVIGPGPGHPNELSHLYPEIKRMIDSSVPILGICLGHQLLAQYFGAKVIHSANIMHGQCSSIDFINHPLYQGLQSPLLVTRYHSLIVDKNSLADDLQPIALTREGELMAFAHKQLPIYGIQYHPEAYLTEHGLKTLQNFLLANKHLYLKQKALS
ncbi:anthranilate synthase component II [Cysteiniphilum halobium]|uniref:anthranilate synthase component II n=1 Tax=Cysteiniphilum halobium TaxID=2219059 RepID=UPI003F828B05